MEKEKRQIIALSQSLFDEKMLNSGINDSNVEELPDMAFISIIGTPQVLSEYLKEENTVHWFKENHPNVLNLEFDDVDHDLRFANCEFKAITPSQSEEIVKFIEANLGKDFIIHCRAGMSRSQAVGCFLYDFYKEYFSESQPYLLRDFANKGVTRELKRILFQKLKIGYMKWFGDKLKVKCPYCGKEFTFTSKEITYGFLYPESIKCKFCDNFMELKDSVK